jgi:hypothetical protein
MRATEVCDATEPLRTALRDADDAQVVAWHLAELVTLAYQLGWQGDHWPQVATDSEEVSV